MTNFYESYLTGIKSATDKALFIKSVKEYLIEANNSFREIKLNDEDHLYFMFEHEYERINGKSVQKEFSGKIVFYHNKEKLEIMNIIGINSYEFLIYCNYKKHELETPSIPKFKTIFHDFISSTTMGEILLKYIRETK